MKKTKIIVPALGMLLLSTAASVTGTVAWFAVNTTVDVTGLQVRAKAEGGIVIAPYTLNKTVVADASVTDASFAYPAANAFGATATTSLGIADLYPTSTNNATNWYHATSNAVDVHTGVAGTYSELVAGSPANGAGFKLDGVQVDGDGSTNPYKNVGQYFLHTKYRVKSTNTLDKFDLYVRSLTVSADANSGALNKSLRVAIKVGSASAVFLAPKYDSLPTGENALKWCTAVSNGNGTLATATLHEGLEPDTQIANQTVVGNNGTTDPYVPAGVDMDIWVYYEGEDPNCKTINTEGITVDTLSLTFTFATAAKPAPVNP